MKNLIMIALFSISFVNAQAYLGKGDNKFQVGANIQNTGTGLNISYDFGVGDNISFGLSSTYLLNVKELINTDFGDRFDFRARFNANLGNVINVDENFDVYPGLSFGLKNFGGHLGLRYFFSDGFGLFTELNTPLSIYKTGVLSASDELNNQFTINLGASFNL